MNGEHDLSKKQKSFLMSRPDPLQESLRTRDIIHKSWPQNFKHTQPMLPPLPLKNMNMYNNRQHNQILGILQICGKLLKY